MENEIRAHVAGVVRELAVEVGDSVRSGQALLRITDAVSTPVLDGRLLLREWRWKTASRSPRSTPTRA